MKTVDFSVETCDKLRFAIRNILDGASKRTDVSATVKVYSCGDKVIRIDLKVMG